MNKNAKIYLAGHNGMVGAALQRAMIIAGFQNVITASREVLDLRDGLSVREFFRRERPECVILAAAKVGGIEANRRFPAEFIADNLMIQTNVIHQAHQCGVGTLVFLGSSCVYPRECPQPMKEEYLLTGPLEPTNEAYAVAKIAGLRMAQYYHQQYGMRVVCPMPCNLYGPKDSFDLQKSHVFSALVKKSVDAIDDGCDQIMLWGTGKSRREFMHVDDLAQAVLLLLEKWYSPEIINVGTGTDVAIAELARLIAVTAGFRGKIYWDATMPDGMPRKCLDITRLDRLGFCPSFSLAAGLESMIRQYRQLKGDFK